MKDGFGLHLETARVIVASWLVCDSWDDSLGCAICLAVGPALSDAARAARRISRPRLLHEGSKGSGGFLARTPEQGPKNPWWLNVESSFAFTQNRCKSHGQNV